MGLNRLHTKVVVRACVGTGGATLTRHLCAIRATLIRHWSDIFGCGNAPFAIFRQISTAASVESTGHHTGA